MNTSNICPLAKIENILFLLISIYSPRGKLMKTGLNSANLKCAYHVFKLLYDNYIMNYNLICRCLQVLAAAVLGLSNQLMDLLYKAT